MATNIRAQNALIERTIHLIVCRVHIGLTLRITVNGIADISSVHLFSIACNGQAHVLANISLVVMPTMELCA